MGNALQRVSGLRGVRLARGLTQADVAKAAGLKGDVLICRWERKPPALWGRLVRICDALTVSADELLGRAPVTPVLDALARQDRELLNAMRDDALALFGEKMIERIGWRKIARHLWLGHLIGRRDQLLPRSSNAAPFVEEHEAKRRVALHRLAAKGYGRAMTALAESPMVEPATAPNAEPFRAVPFPPGWFKGWESPRQKARRLNRPEPKRIAAPQKRRALPKGAP